MAALSPNKFFKEPRVTAALASLKGNPVSDITDGKGNQYVDLVMEGGGVLGIALLGYVYALEKAKIRFLGVGGTSAGAINALATAAADVPGEAKSEKVVELLANMDMWSFVDGDGDAKDFVKSMSEGAGRLKMLWKAAQVLDNINDDLGLNPGRAFEKWLEKALDGWGIKTMRDLKARIEAIPKDLTCGGKTLGLKKAAPKLAIVAAEVTTETKVVFPDFAGLFWKSPNDMNPASFVRASMSIPFFFHPYRVSPLPAGNGAAQSWSELTGYTGTLPTEAIFLDGGIISNFPIDLFHSPGVPMAPTLGVKLGVDRSKPNPVKKPTELLSALFDSARHYSDYDFVSKNPDYQHLITYIDTGKHGWLQFDLPNEGKIDLFARGVEAAVKFLNGFNWDAYKEVRAALAEAEAAGEALPGRR